jgi:carbamoyltransferase
MDHAYLGKPYGEAEIAAALARFRGRPELEQPEDVVGRAADLLADGKIIGWYQAGSEFGPRALGNRSILADPRPKETWGRVNEIKDREWFRPLAPSVLAEAQSEYFELDAASPYMLMVARVRPEKRELLGAITHVDGTARLQTVERDANPRFHRLISAFAERTGIPMLLNTSFNIQAPIAETPTDAVDTFLRSELDALVLGDHVLTRSGDRRAAPARS